MKTIQQHEPKRQLCLLDKKSITYSIIYYYVATEISADNNLITVINVFTVEPHNEEKLVTLLERATEAVI